MHVTSHPSTLETILTTRRSTHPDGVHLTMECLEQFDVPVPTEKELFLTKLSGKCIAHRALLAEALRIGFRSQDRVDQLTDRMGELYNQGVFQL